MVVPRSSRRTVTVPRGRWMAASWSLTGTRGAGERESEAAGCCCRGPARRLRAGLGPDQRHFRRRSDRTFVCDQGKCGVGVAGRALDHVGEPSRPGPRRTRRPPHRVSATPHRPAVRRSCPAPSCWPPHQGTSRTPTPSPDASGRSAGRASAGSTRVRSSTSAPAGLCSTTGPAPPRSPPRSTSCSPPRPCSHCSAPSTASPRRWSSPGRSRSSWSAAATRTWPARRRRPPTRRGPRSPIWPRRPPSL